METKVNYAAVGAFVLALCAALIAGILWLAAGAGNKKHYDHYLAIMHESVAGLNIDAPVKYLGVDVGQVRQIALDPKNPQEVRLLFAIERGTPVKQDTEAVLKTQGLTGIAYVELSGGSPSAAPLLVVSPNEYPVIRTKPSLSARLENVLTTVLANLDNTAANVNAMFDDENRVAVKRILADTSTVMHTLASQKKAIEQGIVDASHTAKNTSKASERLDPMFADISKSADAVTAMAKEGRLAGQSAKVAADEMKSGVQQLSSETLPELSRLLSELRTLSVSLRRLSDQTERNPSSLLRGRQPVPPGPGEKATP